MKKLNCLLVLTVILSAFLSPALAAKSLDEITKYEVSVSPREDGTLDISYHLEWKVLDDIAEGPLTWVKIGIPNEHANEIAKKSNAIRAIKYYSDDGDYVRIDLDRAYRAGETVTLDFSLHQKNMLSLERESNACSYLFTPGWFDEIRVRFIAILWEKKNVIYSNADMENDSLLSWNESLEPGKRLTALVRYPIGAFQITDETETETESASIDKSFVIAGGVIAFLLLLKLLDRIKGSGYLGGFGGTHHSGSHGGCACACACGCACACACAGGGRAGCAAKQFYKPNLSVKALQNALQKTRHADTKIPARR